MSLDFGNIEVHLKNNKKFVFEEKKEMNKSDHSHLTRKLREKLKDNPVIDTKMINKIIILIMSNNVDWVHKTLLLQQLMELLKDVDIKGQEKKLIVKTIFKFVVVEFGGEHGALYEKWIDEEGDFIIDQFVWLAPKLFKKSFWKKFRLFFRNCCCCMINIDK